MKLHKPVSAHRRHFLISAALALPPLLSTAQDQDPKPGLPMMKFLDTPTGRLAYRIAGNTDVQAPTLLLWHSLFADHTMYEPLIEPLSAYRLLLVDAPGCGQSRISTPPLEMAQCVRAALAVMKDAQADKVHVLGCSWGGILGCELALTQPDAVASIMAFNTPFDPEPEASLGTSMILWLSSWMGNSQFFGSRVAGSFFAPEFAAKQPLLREKFIRQFETFDRAGITASARAVLRERQPLSTRLAGINVPTLVVAGKLDSGYPVEVIRSQSQSLPRRRFEELATGHLSPLEDAAATAVLVNQWLQSV